LRLCSRFFLAARRVGYEESGQVWLGCNPGYLSHERYVVFGQCRSAWQHQPRCRRHYRRAQASANIRVPLEVIVDAYTMVFSNPFGAFSFLGEYEKRKDWEYMRK
jgi:hypothetical protein